MNDALMAQLCQLEPRLLDLYRETQAVTDNGKTDSFCANAIWCGRGSYPDFKERILDLVGWRLRGSNFDPRLWTSEAYDIAYDTIYDALPPCRNCACVAWDDYVGDVLEQRGFDRAVPIRAYGAKERPRCRRSIIESDLRPYIEKGKWTGWAATPDGKRVYISGGMRTQMRLMMAQGYWPDMELKQRRQPRQA